MPDCVTNQLQPLSRGANVYKTAWFCIVFLGSSCQSSAVEAWDIRDCPIGDVTFVDPWAGYEFHVNSVGGSYRYQCDEAGWVDNDIETDLCRRFGFTALVGEKIDTDGIKSLGRFVAVYYIAPAAPCCGWEVKTETLFNESSDSRKVEWFTARTMPKLSSFPFASIEGMGNDLLALKCAAQLGSSQSQNVQDEQYPQASLLADNVGFVKSFFQSRPQFELAQVQVLLSQWGYSGQIDGEWGQMTENAITASIDTYIRIGGENWILKKPSDAPDFLSWLEDVAKANATGGEFPD